MVIVIMGVSGSGKTTVGRLLAEELGWSFYEGDDFHPPENVARMRAGIALTDEDRRPWLERLQKLIAELNRREESAVLTCSALKASYRNLLREADDGMAIVYLRGEYDLIWRRMKERQGHYMPARLLKSQFAALEEPERAIAIEARYRPKDIVEKIVEALDPRGETERPAYHRCVKPTALSERLVDAGTSSRYRWSLSSAALPAMPCDGLPSRASSSSSASMSSRGWARTQAWAPVSSPAPSPDRAVGRGPH